MSSKPVFLYTKTRQHWTQIVGSPGLLVSKFSPLSTSTSHWEQYLFSSSAQRTQPQILLSLREQSLSFEQVFGLFETLVLLETRCVKLSRGLYH